MPMMYIKSSIWAGFEIKNWIEDQFQWSPKLVGIWTVLRCIFVLNLEIVTSIGGELWHAQAQNGVNFDFGVQFDLEGQDQSSHKTIVIRWRPSQKRQAAGHNRQHVISRRLRVFPMCPEWLRLSLGLPSPAEAGLWQLTQGSQYGSHHARSLETSWWIGNKNCQILRRTHSKLCYM